MDAALTGLLARWYPFQDTSCEEVAALCRASTVLRFAAGQPVLVSPDGGCRAELAVFLLRQAEREAWLPAGA